MLFIKYICLVIFALIIILFTVGYASQPVLSVNINFTANVNNINNQIEAQLQQAQAQAQAQLLAGQQLPELPKLPEVQNNIELANEQLNLVMFIDKIGINNNGQTTNMKYGEIDNTLGFIFTAFKYLCIGVSVIIATGITLSIFRLKFISKLVMILALIIMMIITICLIIIYATNYLKDALNSLLQSQNIVDINISNTNIKYELGGMLMSISTILMFVNYTIYVFLA